MDISYLDRLIRKVSPNFAGVSIGDPASKATWRLDFATTATEAEKTAAAGVVASFDPASTDPVAALAGSDAQMARGAEDLIALLLAKGTIAKTDLAPQLLAHLNARRALRGEAAL